MIGMQDEDAIERAHKHVVDLVLLAGNGKHHAHEVCRVREIVFRVNVGFANRVLIGHCHQTGHLADQLYGRHGALLRIEQIAALGVERRHGADQARQNGHRVCVASEPLQELMHRLMNERVVHHQIFEIFLLLRIGKLTVQKQVANFQVVAVARELLNRIAAVKKLARRTVDVGDGAFAGGRAHEARIVGELARLFVQSRNVDDFGAHRAGDHRQRNLGRTIGKHELNGLFFSHDATSATDGNKNFFYGRMPAGKRRQRAK